MDLGRGSALEIIHCSLNSEHAPTTALGIQPSWLRYRVPILKFLNNSVFKRTSEIQMTVNQTGGINKWKQFLYEGRGHGQVDGFLEDKCSVRKEPVSESSRV